MEGGPQFGGRFVIMETEYLKRCFGNSLTQALEEVAKVRPSDPIEYLAYWLYHYRKTSKAKENRKEEIQLKEEHDNSLKETKTTEMLKQEEYQIQQRDEQCDKPLTSVASSTEKTKSMQENTKPLEKEALEQESLPSTSIMNPDEPQEISFPVIQPD
ncbi:DPY30 domain-containing protein 2 [Galemys pyrenaicus]|uniref:DPY30 domain-containing protein 2 n=1 Tax=Galemys pyrenaicus TaxID=202257 RepID=A0A8J6AJ43_GALPY|nr:DPY30 domain-containing protein 2 [Galemys pyrenaicus]